MSDSSDRNTKTPDNRKVDYMDRYKNNFGDYSRKDPDTNDNNRPFYEQKHDFYYSTKTVKCEM